MWGAQDRFATAKMAHRFHAELEGSELEIFDEAGHFVWEDVPEQAARTLVDFLQRSASPPTARSPQPDGRAD